MNTVFVNYGKFGNNSSNHINGFARGLAELGHKVGLVAEGEPDETIPGVSYASYAELRQSESGGAVAKMLSDRSTLLHVWTPRERVRRWVEPLAESGLRYLVHLEDDEEIVTASQLRRSPAELDALDDAQLDRQIPIHLSHPRHFRTFLASAAGITVIVDALRAFTPEGVPCRVITPGADLSLFKGLSDPRVRAARRASLGVGSQTTMLAFHGAIHPAVQRDIFSLYTAVSKLRRRGHDVALLRIGQSRDTSETSSLFRLAEGVLEVAAVPRTQLPAWLDLADIYVQPGAPSVFNHRRLPSKLLDFLAMGRPVILPETCAGLLGFNETEALHLKQGGAEEIVRCVLRLMADPDLMARLGRRGREWVEREFDWDDKVRSLEAFYATL